MPKIETDEAFLARISRGRGSVQFDDLRSLAADDLARFATLCRPALWVERKSYASEGRALARKLKASLDGFHTLPLVATIDEAWFFRVCMGLACDVRLNFDTSTDSASSGAEAKEVLELIFKALVGSPRRHPRSRRLAERRILRGLPRIPASTSARSFSYGELHTAMVDVLTGERRVPPARKKTCWEILECHGFTLVVKRELRKSPAGSISEAAARRKANAILGYVFGASPALIRVKRHRERTRAKSRPSPEA